MLFMPKKNSETRLVRRLTCFEICVQMRQMEMDAKLQMQDADTLGDDLALRAIIDSLNEVFECREATICAENRYIRSCVWLSSLS